MPLQNRVTPLGEIVAVPERGLVYGNRGLLHDRDGAIRREFAASRHVFPNAPGARRRRARLFGVDVVVDEVLPPGTWRLESRS